MIGCNEVMVMNVDQCKLCYHMLCAHDVSYASFMLYASYASFMLYVHDASYANHYDKHWSIMTPCYASLVFDYMQVHIWHVMQVWCLIICK